MLYASTRTNLIKALGSAPFTDSIFATSKADVTSSAYKAHRASLNAPKPMTAREKEMEEIKAAELSSASYDGSRSRKSHVGGKLGFKWTDDVEAAVKRLGECQIRKLLVLVSTGDLSVMFLSHGARPRPWMLLRNRSCSLQKPV